MCIKWSNVGLKYTFSIVDFSCCFHQVIQSYEYLLLIYTLFSQDFKVSIVHVLLLRLYFSFHVLVMFCLEIRIIFQNYFVSFCYCYIADCFCYFVIAIWNYVSFIFLIVKLLAGILVLFCELDTLDELHEFSMFLTH